MHRSHPHNSESRTEFSPSPSHDPVSPRHPVEIPGKTVNLSPNPYLHAKALIESFGGRIALQIAQVNAQMTGPTGTYWADVLDNMVDAWGRPH
jgi:hypothetical protein